MLESVVTFFVELARDWGYWGVFALMFVESSFFIPFPSEVVMIPAGYLVSQGQMSAAGAFAAGVGGSLAGALCNYYVCFFLGRPFVARYGKYVRITDEKMRKFEAFFDKYGEISTFNCRLIPGVRQYISLPAGLARMHVGRFCLYTSLGAGIWVAILIAVGYYIGENTELIKENMHIITIALLGFVAAVSVGYYWLKVRPARRRNGAQNSGENAVGNGENAGENRGENGDRPAD